MLSTIPKQFTDYWAYHWRIERRHSIQGIFEWDQRVVTLVEHTCNLKAGMKILDLGCGGGDQLKVFAERGYNVTGIDIAPVLIEFAQKQFSENLLQGEFVCSDMRNIAYANSYDACVLLSFTFGFFMDDGDQELLYKVNCALVMSGKIFIMFMAPREAKLTRTWEAIKDGYALTEEWYNSEKCIFCSRNIHILSEGKIIIPSEDDVYNANETIRCYTVPEMKKMLELAGFSDMQFYSHKNISNYDHVPDPAERLNIVVATKKSDLIRT